MLWIEKLQLNLVQQIDIANADDKIKVVIITGDGERNDRLDGR
jgi:enoyl-CoA hydratase/carnithine racemase